MKIALIYHFFANYRQPIIDKLSSGKDVYKFVADDVNIVTPGLPIANIPSNSFKLAKCIKLGGGFIIQPNIVKYAIISDDDVLIYLGDWKFITTWIAASISRIRGKRVLFWTHGWTKNDKGIVKKLRISFYKLAHGLLLYGERAKKIGVGYGFDPASIYVVNNSLDVKRQLQLRSQITERKLEDLRFKLFPNDFPVLLCCSRMNKERRLDLLIQAALGLAKDGVNVNVLLIGDGSERNRLKSMGAELGDQLYFTGACYDESLVARYTMLSDVTVCPGAIGLAVMQSMIYGVPVITNDDFEKQGPEVEAVLDGETGYLFRAESLQSLMSKIKTFIELGVEAKLNMSSKCRGTIEKSYHVDYQEDVFYRAARGEVSEEI